MIKQMNKQEAFKIVYDEMIKCQLFCGVYDAKNGNLHFMYGISTVMEQIAYEAGGDKLLYDFQDKFDYYMRKSENKALNNKRKVD